MSKSFVYFIRPVGQIGPIKIGCSMRPEARLAEFDRGSPVPLELAATIPGGEALEGAIHNHLRESHARLEWFGPTPEVITMVADILQGTFNPNIVEEKKWRPDRIHPGWQNRGGNSTTKEIIDMLGGYRAVAAHLGVTHGRVANWMLKDRSIPWRFRSAIAALTQEKDVPLPAGFLDP